MTTFWLIRHALVDPVGKSLAGRAPGVALNAKGRAQAAALAERLAGSRVEAIYSSPLERTMETARAVAERLRLPVQISDALVEVEVGEWTGRTLGDLERDERWRQWNAFRAGTRAPGGELMLDVQQRTVAELGRLRERHGRATVIVVSHADPIKAVLLYYLGAPLDNVARVEIGPASVSVLELGDWGARVLRLNDIGGIPPT